MQKKRWYKGKVVKIIDESPSTKRFFVEIQDSEIFDYKSGQFVTMDLPIHEKRLKRWRSYSIANAANHYEDANVLEFVIVRSESGLGTKYLFEEVGIGTDLNFKKPSGVFVLPKSNTSDLVFVCTGTGIAPFRAMIQSLYKDGEPKHKVHLVFGTRHESGILYRKEMERYAEKYPSFTYSVALSRDKIEAYDNSYVHSIYEKYYYMPNPNINFYLCGWQNMIDEAVMRIKQLGFYENQIHYELYG